MKRLLTSLSFLLFTFGNAQIQATLKSTEPLIADVFVGVDQFNNLYAIKNNSLYKNKEKTYTNFSYGKLTSVDISNPYKIVLFYSDFNTVVVLDNQLNETDKIVFDYNIAAARKSGSNNLWLFNRDEATIEIYNYKSKSIEQKTVPLLESNFMHMKSNLNQVFVQSDSLLNTYDYLGNHIAEQSIKFFGNFEINNNKIIYLKNKQLYLQEQSEIKKIELPPLKIENFYFSQMDLYIFDGLKVNHFTLNKND